MGILFVSNLISDVGLIWFTVTVHDLISVIKKKIQKYTPYFSFFFYFLICSYLVISAALTMNQKGGWYVYWVGVNGDLRFSLMFLLKVNDFFLYINQ